MIFLIFNILDIFKIYYDIKDQINKYVIFNRELKVGICIICYSYVFIICYAYLLIFIFK